VSTLVAVETITLAPVSARHFEPPFSHHRYFLDVTSLLVIASERKWKRHHTESNIRMKLNARA
jgi:hypothetical protein